MRAMTWLLCRIKAIVCHDLVPVSYNGFRVPEPGDCVLLWLSCTMTWLPGHKRAIVCHYLVAVNGYCVP